MNKRFWLFIMGLFVLLLILTALKLLNDRDQPVARDEPPLEEWGLEEGQDAEQAALQLLARMTLEEKVGQMMQVERGEISPKEVTTYFIGSILSGGGSVPKRNTPEAWADMHDDYQEAARSTRLGIPILYGVDAVHGHNNLYGATIFPHNIGLGATRDAELVRRIGEATATEVNATGPEWNFAPCVCVPLDERWGRTYEGYSEEPVLAAELGAAFVKGTQEGEHRVIATLKHWVGDGATAGGVDQGDIQLAEEQLRKLMEPYKAGIDAGALSVMVSFSSWNGLKTHGDRYLITEVLKEELGFEGIVLSDYNGVNQVDPSLREAVKQSIQAGIDMIMAADGWRAVHASLLELAKSGEIPMTRIDDAVLRILKVKLVSGVFEHPYTDRDLLKADVVGAAAHRELAREAVRKSLVLLQNDNTVLPLKKEMKLLVAGPRADDIGVQSGGWTMTWQGSKGRITEGTTILQGLKEVVGASGKVTYSPDGKGAEGHDAAVIVVGEDPYAEYLGDQRDLRLDPSDLAVIEEVSKTGIPTVVVLLSGRPMIVTDWLEDVDALVAAWLPGTEGAGVADVLLGDYPFTGKLPMSWPRTMEQIPINIGDDPYDPLFPYGFRLDIE